MYFTLYRVFSSFHQHNFVSLSLSFCADVTGFVTEKTDGARDTKKKTLIRTVYARNEGCSTCLTVSPSVLLYSILFFLWLYLSISISFYLSFFLFLPLSLHFFLPSSLSFFSFCHIPQPSSVIRSSPCATFLTPVLPSFRHTVGDCNGLLTTEMTAVTRNFLPSSTL